MGSGGAGDKAGAPSGSTTHAAQSVSADPSVVSGGRPGLSLSLSTFRGDALRGRPPHSPDIHHQGDDSRLLLRPWRPQTACTALSTP